MKQDPSAPEYIPFSEVTRVEYVLGGDTAQYEIVAVGINGDRYVVQASDDSPLDGRAEHVARTMVKPFEKVKNVKTFAD